LEPAAEPPADPVLEELRFHLEGRADELVERGWTRHAARDEAKRRFGDLDRVRSLCMSLDRQRERRRSRKMTAESWRQDLRLAWRALAQRKGFTALAVLTLALGIGAATAVFSLVNGLLLRPLPYPEAERLVVVWETDRRTGTQREAASVPDYLDFEARSRVLAGVAAFAATEANLTSGSGEPRQVGVVRASHDLAELLGLAPLLGRDLLPADDVPAGPSVALVTEGFWRSALEADLEVVGRVIELDDRPHEIVGVLPGPTEVPAPSVDIWVPMQQTAETSPRYTHGTSVLARLAGGVTVAAAQEDLDRVAAELEAEYPQSNTERGVFVEPLAQVLRGDLRAPLFLLLGSVLAVLLIACANVANLMLARGSERRRELAIASALGESGARRIRRFLVESALLSAAAGLAGVACGAALLRVALRAAPAEVVGRAEIGLDGVSVGFACLLVSLVTAGFTLVPLAQAQRFDLQASLRSGQGGARARGRLLCRRSLVVVQMAAALLLLAGAALLIDSMRRLLAVDAGFDTDNVLRAEYRLPVTRYPRDFARYPRWPEVNRFNADLLAGAAALPGVRSATVTSQHPLDPGFTNSFVVVGREDESSEFGELTTRLVSHGYFVTNGVEVLEGRDFDAQDTADARLVVVVNQTAVERYFDGYPVLGERIRFWGLEREIVGIVADERMHGLESAAPPAMYAALAQAPQASAATLMLRTEGDPLALAGPVRRLVRDLDPEIAVYDVATMEQTLAASVAQRRFTSSLLGVFALAAVALAALGVHGVLSYLVEQRRREIGLRMAIGASRARVLRSILGEGLSLAALGVALGAGGAALLSPLVRSQLFDVTAGEPGPWAVVCTGLLAVAALSCALPALRATRVDPVRALRTE
jgi:predicted permease